METKNPYIYYISYIRDQIIWEKPTSDELKCSLDKELAELNNHEDRAKLLSGIYKIFTDRFQFIDNYKLGNLTDFSRYVKHKIEKENSTIEAKSEWSELYNDLIGEYIQKDVSLSDFDFVMTYHRLPDGAGRITWTGERNKGYAFGKHFGFTNLPDFNKCFVPIKGEDFRGNDNTPIKGDYEKILVKHNK